VALAVVVSAGASSPGAAAPSKTTPPPTAPPPTGGAPTLPPLPTTTGPDAVTPVTITPATVTPATGPTTTAAAGTTQLADTTGRITMSVPAAWSDTDLRPFVRDDGGRRPSIEASPDLASYLQGWTIPGAFLVALPPQDASSLIAAWSWNSSCREGDPQPFANSRFSGFTQTWSQCGGGTAEIVELAVTAADGTYSVYVNVRSPMPDPATSQLIFDSIAPVLGANPGEVSAPLPVPATTAASDPSFAAPIAPAGFTTVTDDTGRLSFAADPTWTDVNTVPRDNDDLSARPTIRVAPSLDAYSREWSSSGLSVSVFPQRADPYTILANTAPTGSCTDAGIQPLTLPAGSGYLQTWTNCGGTTTRLVQFVLTPPDQSSVLWGEVQLPSADNSALVAVLASIAVTP
jgi:hypothetical protein